MKPRRMVIMAFKKKNVERVYTKYKECNAGDVIVEGIYQRVVEGRYGIQHEFRHPDEEVARVLNSSGHLNFLLSEYANFGDYCRVTYEGSIKLDKGPMKGKDAHQFSLEIDDERFDPAFNRADEKAKIPNKGDNIATPELDEALEDMSL
jgi:hypothetical protein